MKSSIGRLEKIKVRDIWSGEATDFTPWLAKTENIEILSEAVGIDLEVIMEEKSVGPFRADILCKNTIDGTYVLIENQLEKTDHTHLGQLMTYAAGLEAVNIIWIAQRFTEEHRAALDWLNRSTDDQLNFFGIEIEVYKIGDSKPAPLFQIVAKPNDWTKSVHSNASKKRGITKTEELYLEFWTFLREYLTENESFLKCQKPLAQSWTSYSIGKTGFFLAAAASVRNKILRVELAIVANEANSYFDQLHDMYFEDSKSNLSSDIDWQKLPGKQMCRIALSTKGDLNKKHKWDEYSQWFHQTLEQFSLYFGPKIKELGEY